MYLLDIGDVMYLYLSRGLHAMILERVFGVTRLNQVSFKYKLITSLVKGVKFLKYVPLGYQELIKNICLGLRLMRH